MMNINDYREVIKAQLSDVSLDCVTYAMDSYATYLDSCFQDFADNNVDIYYYNLNNWMIDHIAEVEEAINEFGWHGDLHQAVQEAQYTSYTNTLYSEEELIKEMIVLNALDDLGVLAIDESLYNDVLDLFGDSADISIIETWFENFCEDCEENPEMSELIERKAA